MIAAVVVAGDAPPPALAAALGPGRAAALHAVLVERTVAWARALTADVTVTEEPPARRAGQGPLLLARAACPRLSAAHAVAALGDLDAGCDLSIGSTLEGDWYLAALRAPEPALLAALDRPFGDLFRLAADGGAEVGLLRHERALRTPADAAAFRADPLTPAAVLSAL